MIKAVMSIILAQSTIFIILVLLFLPNISRENIFFGVNVPVYFKKSKEAKGFLREYQRNYLITIFVPTLLCFYLLFNKDIMITVKYTVLYSLFLIFAASTNFYFVNRKVLNFKRQNQLIEGKRQIVVVELKRREDIEKYPSRWWFLLPISILLLSFIVILLRYNYLPQKIPIHYNANFEVDSWVDKPKLFQALMPIYATSFPIIVLFYILYELNKKSKLKLSIFDPPKSSSQNNQIKRATAFFLIIGLSIIQIIFFVIILSIVGVIDAKKILIFTTIFSSTVVLIITAVFIIKITKIYEQKGHPQDEVYQKIIDRDDDRYWIGGMLYYNPDDPALLVEKRVGLGWDFNYAKPAAKFFAFVIIAIVVGIIIMVLSL